MQQSKSWIQERFNIISKQRFGMTPIEDDSLLLQASIEFNQLWKDKKLSEQEPWHVALVDNLINAKLNTIKNNYE